MGQACCGSDAKAAVPVKKTGVGPADKGVHSPGSSTKKKSQESKKDSLRLNLLREQEDTNFDQIYDIVEIIGEGSISNISKIRRKESAVGGSSRPEFVAEKKKRSSGLGQSLEECESSIQKKESSHPEEYYALKEIDLSFVKKEHIDELENEVKLLQDLDHPNIIRAYETFHVKNRLAIVLELCSGGDLYTRHPYSEAEAARIVSQVVSAVAYLHKRGIIHRDIKFENVMFENTGPTAQVKLIDFGLAKAYLGRALTERVGTLYTMSPQVLRGEYTSQADLWSVGVVTYMLLSGEKPFWSNTRKELIHMIAHGMYSFSGRVWKHRSKESKDFVQKLLQTDPEKRLTADQALNHAWLSEKTYWSDRKPEVGTLSLTQANLVRYADSPEFKKLALNVIARKSSAQEIFELRKVFDEIDTANDGTITYKEFQEALTKFNYSDEEIKKMFSSIDINRNGVILYTEFLAATLEIQGRIQEYRIAEAFDQLDCDDSGYITPVNLRKILGSTHSDDYVNSLIRELDVDGDGQISYDEFKALFEEKVAENVADMMCESSPGYAC